MFFNKVVFVASVNEMCKFFRNPNVFQPSSCIYDDRIVIKHSIIPPVPCGGNCSAMQGERIHSIRAWKTKSVFDLWYEDFTTRTFVAALDYEIKEDHVKIQYMNINDKESVKATYGEGSEASRINIKLHPSVDTIESIQINRALLNYVKDVAIEEKKNKVIVDVHENLRIFNIYYRREGFHVTDRKCSDNPYWIETEFTIDDLGE